MNDRIIRVQGQATVKAIPDEAILSFTVSASDPNYGTAIGKMNELVDALRRDMERVGIDRSSLKTTRFNVETDYKTVNKREVFNCYVAVHGLAVHIPMDKEKLNRVLEAAAQSASQARFNLALGVKDQTPLRQKALEEAVAMASRNAQTLAQAASITLGQLLRIEYGWAEVRVSSGSQYTLSEQSCGVMAPDITPDDVEAEDSVTMVWEIN